MFESVKRSGVLDNPWLPLILCVVLAVLWGIARTPYRSLTDE